VGIVIFYSCISWSHESHLTQGQCSWSPVAVTSEFDFYQSIIYSVTVIRSIDDIVTDDIMTAVSSSHLVNHYW